jgi:beta-phosphoglucomutase
MGFSIFTFDMGGVLIDAMSFHAEAMRLAIKEETKHDINNKVVYLLQGLPGSKLVKEIFQREKIDENLDNSIAERIGKKKKEIFKEIQNSKPIEGARELINDLKSCRCLQAVVSGSSKEEIETILDKNIGSNNFIQYYSWRKPSCGRDCQYLTTVEDRGKRILLSPLTFNNATTIRTKI